MKNKILTLLIALLGFSINAISQNPNFTWAKQLGGTGSDVSNSVFVDGSGNVYTTGYFNGTADFDPGAGAFNMTAAGGSDIFISKIDASGNFVWAKQLGGAGADNGNALYVDGIGNVYTTGYFSGTGDFNPGAGTFNMTSAGFTDIFISKLDASGNFVWAKQIGGASPDLGTSIIVDGSGNIFTTGSYAGTVDFDPNAGSFNMISVSGSDDAFISKLDATGNFVFAKSIGGTSIDAGTSIVLDGTGSIYTSGYFYSTADFDPSAGTFNMTAAGLSDVFISKLDASGNFVFAKQMGGSGGDDRATSITLDGTGNIYTTGYFAATSDFDPGAGTFNMTSLGLEDVFISKLDASGNFVFAKQIGSTGSELSYGIKLDVNGNIYTTGGFQNTADFDPGAGVVNLISSGGYDTFISKLNSAGNYIWAGQIGSTTADYGLSIAIDAALNVYITGRFTLSPDFNAGAGSFNMTSFGNDDAFVTKYCQSPDQPSTITGSTPICAGTNNTYSIGIVAGATSYTWSLPGGWSGTSTTNTISATPGTSGNITVTANNTCGASLPQTLSVTVNPLPTVTATASPSSNICVGSLVTLTGGGASTYAWSGGVIDAVAFSPTTTLTYTVTGTDLNSCQNTATKTITVNPLPTVTYSQTPSLVCANNTSVPLTGVTPSGGAFSGTAVTGATFNAVAAGVGSYTITYTYTDVNSCVNTATSNITVSACTGIQQNTIANEIMIYPNPFSSIITLQGIEAGAIVEVFNLLGEKIYSSQLTKDKTEINLSNESNGIYFIKIGSVTRKIIKQ